MATVINGETYYRTSEVCKLVNISRSTLLRWTEAGIISDVKFRDRRNWRLFSAEDIKKMEEEAFRLR